MQPCGIWGSQENTSATDCLYLGTHALHYFRAFSTITPTNIHHLIETASYSNSFSTQFVSRRSYLLQNQGFINVRVRRKELKEICHNCNPVGSWLEATTKLTGNKDSLG